MDMLTRRSRPELADLLRRPRRPAQPLLALGSALAMIAAIAYLPGSEQPAVGTAAIPPIAAVVSPSSAAAAVVWEPMTESGPLAESPPSQELGWWKVNPHAHLNSVGPYRVRDDGRLSISYWLERYAEKGFDLVYFTPHSSKNKGPVGAERWLRTREALKAYSDSFNVALGEEASVRHGPAYRVWRKSDWIGRVMSPLNHVVVLGASEFVPHAELLGKVTGDAHRLGGVAILAHRQLWDQGGWDSRDNLDTLDGFEVYNGIVLDVTEVDNAAVYRHAISYGGMRLKMAAIGASDTHRRDHLAETATWFAGLHPESDLFLEAVRTRRTFATDGFDDIHVDVAKLGAIRSEADVDLSIEIDRVVARITLWREERAVKTWEDTAAAAFQETIAAATVYSWEIEDGDARGHSSGIWFEPVRASY